MHAERVLDMIGCKFLNMQTNNADKIGKCKQQLKIFVSSMQTGKLKKKNCIKMCPKRLQKIKNDIFNTAPVCSNNMMQSHNNIFRTCINVTAGMNSQRYSISVPKLSCSSRLFPYACNIPLP